MCTCSFSYPHTWVGTILSISVVTYLAYKATVDPESIAALEEDDFQRLKQEYILALVSALCINIYIVGINQVWRANNLSPCLQLLQNHLGDQNVSVFHL